MPSESSAQHGFAAMSTTEVGRRKLRAKGRKPMPVSVAQDYLHADKGRSMKVLPRHVKGKQ